MYSHREQSGTVRRLVVDLRSGSNLQSASIPRENKYHTQIQYTSLRDPNPHKIRYKYDTT